MGGETQRTDSQMEDETETWSPIKVEKPRDGRRKKTQEEGERETEGGRGEGDRRREEGGTGRCGHIHAGRARAEPREASTWKWKDGEWGGGRSLGGVISCEGGSG